MEIDREVKAGGVARDRCQSEASHEARWSATTVDTCYVCSRASDANVDVRPPLVDLVASIACTDVRLCGQLLYSQHPTQCELATQDMATRRKRGRCVVCSCVERHWTCRSLARRSSLHLDFNGVLTSSRLCKSRPDQRNVHDHCGALSCLRRKQHQVFVTNAIDRSLRCRVTTISTTGSRAPPGLADLVDVCSVNNCPCEPHLPVSGHERPEEWTLSRQYTADASTCASTCARASAWTQRHKDTAYGVVVVARMESLEDQLSGFSSSSKPRQHERRNGAADRRLEL